MNQPTRAFVEIGVVEFYTPGGGAGGWAGSVADARARASEFVCKAGGDAIILNKSTSGGAFTSATVVVYN